MANEITYFSMFTGIGGFELGLEGGDGRREFRCVGFSEIDKFACQVLRRRFPEIKNFGDITEIDPTTLPDCDLLCGGFPCQAFSIAGKRRGFKDPRGNLFIHIANVVETKRPSLVLLENVKGLLSHEGGKTHRIIVQTLAELGYDVQWMVLNSKLFGVPQNRERVFLVASSGRDRRPQILPLSGRCPETPELQEPTTYTVKASGGPKSYLAELDQLQQTRGNGQGANVYKATGISQTLTSKGGGLGGQTGLYLHKARIRRLTPTECERLQGFPDDWTKLGTDEQGRDISISDTQRFKQIGNAVTVPVIRAIAEKLAAGERPRRTRRRKK